MPKKEFKAFKQLEQRIATYKWKFLRRNEDYIKDCERWSGRKRQDWGKNIEFVLTMKGAPDENCVDDRIGLRYMRRVDRTWKKYADKWKTDSPLNPLNPNTETLTFFMENMNPLWSVISAPTLSPSEQRQFNKENNKTTSMIMVDWANPPSFLEYAFKQTLDRTVEAFKLRGLVFKPKKVYFDLYDTYLDIWDKREVKHMTYKAIAREVFSNQLDEYETNLDSLESRAKGNYRECQKLIRGDYKKI